MERGECRLDDVRAAAIERQRPVQGRTSLRDLVEIPERAVLVSQEHHRPVGEPCVPPRVADQHQRHEPMHLRFVGHQLGECSPEPDRLGGQRPAPAVALVEDQVDDAEHRVEAVRQQVRRRHAERDAGRLDLPLRAHEPLRHRLVGDEERPRDLLRGETAESTERERDLCVEREGGVAAGEQSSRRSSLNIVSSISISVCSGTSSSCVFSASVRSRRMRSTARFRAVVTSHARGLTGVPSRGQRAAAIANASCAASSARSKSPRRPIRLARTRPHSSRNTCSSDRLPLLVQRAHLDRTAHTSRGDACGELDRSVEVVRLVEQVAAERFLDRDERPVGRQRLAPSTRTVVAVSGPSIQTPGVTPGVSLIAW